MKNKSHRPKQIIKKGWVIYFISARTYYGISHINQDKKKRIFKNILFKKAKKYNGEIKHWVVFKNHYHLLVEFENGENLSKFIKEIHGATSRLIGKIPVTMILNEEQIFDRQQTAMERRMKQRIERLWRGLKSAKTVGEVGVAGTNNVVAVGNNVLADFSRRQKERGLKSAKAGEDVVVAGTNNVVAVGNNVLADFSLRLKTALTTLNFSKKTISQLFNSQIINFLYNSFQSNDKKLFETIMLVFLPDIPFWCNYYSHVVKSERDFYAHFNYITQNPIKHGFVKNPWDYKFSGLERYDKEYVRDCLRLYPIIDFGGNYE